MAKVSSTVIRNRRFFIMNYDLSKKEREEILKKINRVYEMKKFAQYKRNEKLIHKLLDAKANFYRNELKYIRDYYVD